MTFYVDHVNVLFNFFSEFQGAELLLVNGVNQQLCLLIGNLYSESSNNQVQFMKIAFKKYFKPSTLRQFQLLLNLCF